MLGSGLLNNYLEAQTLWQGGEGGKRIHLQPGTLESIDCLINSKREAKTIFGERGSHCRGGRGAKAEAKKGAAAKLLT